MSRDSVKYELFVRDGWKDVDPLTGNERWYAHCAGGCGTQLTRNSATVDRYPVPGMAGGTYHIDNTRLVCTDCNNRMASHGNTGPSILEGMSHWQRKVFRRAQRRGTSPVITPQDIFGKDYEPGLGKPNQEARKRHFLAAHPELADEE